MARVGDARAARILVTGGAGFIGSHVVDRLVAEGHAHIAVLDDLSASSVTPDEHRVTFLKTDLRDARATATALRAFLPTHVCHMAAQVSVGRSVQSPSDDAQANLVATLHLLEACRDVGVEHFVYASSGGAAYGEVAEGSNGAREDWPVRPKSPYGVSKTTVETYLRVLGELAGLPSTILRFANVYGPRQRSVGEGGVVAIFADRVAAGAPVELNGRRERGDAGCIRDYIYVDDAAEATLRALDGTLGRSTDGSAILNVGSGTRTTTRELVAFVSEASGRAARTVDQPPRPGDVEVNFLCIDRILAHGWRPRVSLREGIQRTVRWHQERQQMPHAAG